jgi:uncharacterized protein YbjQ (UPF0145 family)
MISITLGVLTTTAQHIQGRPVREYLGVVSGEAVAVVRCFLHRSGGQDTSLQHGRRRALQALANRASAHGATVVIGIDIDYVPVGVGMVLVAATGTAVRL